VSRSGATISATTVVPASPEAVFRFLSRLENHWRLADRWIEVVELNDGSGRVRIRGPLGLKRTARTTVVDATPDHVIHGTAELSGGTVARIAWDLREDAGGTAVRLSGEIERAAPLDRVLLALGGAAWMRGRFERILARLAEQLS
jgi:uncharacterized protein YndB with AHSA1/START domain